jgi:hypothetical protein
VQTRRSMLLDDEGITPAAPRCEPAGLGRHRKVTLPAIFTEAAR